MSLNPVAIRNKNLILRACIGINDDKVANTQDVIINVKIDYPTANSDNMNEAPNDKSITDNVLSIPVQYPWVTNTNLGAKVDTIPTLRFSNSVSLCLS